jgi:hypothetical protein
MPDPDLRGERERAQHRRAHGHDENVRNELVSVAAARADYGVVVVAEPMAVDEVATRALRERQRRARNWPQTPAISWEPSDIAMAAE